MDTTRTILVADDEPAMRRLLRRCFESEGYAVREAGSAVETLAALGAGGIDLVTLDLNLGGKDGLQIARRARDDGMDVAIVVVSGKGELIDRVVGLEVGADDYIAKPFELREVLARVRSVLRRTRPPKVPSVRASVSAAPDARAQAAIVPDAAAANGDAGDMTGTHGDGTGAAAAKDVYRFARCELDVPAREFRGSDGEPRELTTAEFELLHLFLRAGRRALSRDRIMDGLRGADWHPNDRAIDNHVARLRRKLDAAGALRAVRTVRGIGYQFAASISHD